MMDYANESCRDFVAALASSRPAPGGGGAAALVGAIGTALGHMVGNLAVKQAAAGTADGEAPGQGEQSRDVTGELRRLIAKCGELETELLDQIQADEAGFLPLLEAWRLPADVPDRARLLEERAAEACRTPLHIMELCCEAIGVIAESAEGCSSAAVSDAACAAVCLKAALMTASMNVYVNTAAMNDREAAGRMNCTCGEMLQIYGGICDRIYETVRRMYTK